MQRTEAATTPTRRGVLGATAASVTAGCIEFPFSSDASEPIDLERLDRLETDAWPVHRCDPANTGTNARATGVADPSSVERIGASISDVVVADDRAYLGGKPAESIHTAGPSRWTAAHEPEARVVGVASEVVVVAETWGSNRQFRTVALDRETGAVRWRRDVGGRMAPAVVGNAVFVAQTAQPKLLALETETGETRWSTGGLAPAGIGYANGVVVVTSTGTVDAFEASTGERLWTVESADTFTSPVLDDETAYVGTNEGLLFAVALETGDVRWEKRVFPPNEGFNVAAPALCDDVLLVPSDNHNRSMGIDVADGSELWRAPTGICAAPPAADGDRAYFPTANRGFMAIDAGSGAIVWRDGGIGGWTIGPSVVDDAVYAVDNQHQVVKIS